MNPSPVIYATVYEDGTFKVLADAAHADEVGKALAIIAKAIQDEGQHLVEVFDYM